MSQLDLANTEQQPATSVFDTPVSVHLPANSLLPKALADEIGIVTYQDILGYFPYRFEDRTKVTPIAMLQDQQHEALIKGILEDYKISGFGKTKRLNAKLRDDTGSLELTFFNRIDFFQKTLQIGSAYYAYGKPTFFLRKPGMTHPELSMQPPPTVGEHYLTPVYSLPEKFKRFRYGNKEHIKLVQTVLKVCHQHIHENLPDWLVEEHGLFSKRAALVNVHFPRTWDWLQRAKHRMKLEELLFLQLELGRNRLRNKEDNPGFVIKDMALVQDFYKHHLPFELTGAQKRVLREIYADMGSARQMNRLLQGDVGSGKTMVGFIACLMVIGNEMQACLMAPTEILAEQHFRGLEPLAKEMGITIAKLTGSTKPAMRRTIHDGLESGELKLIVGTHALLEANVRFKALGLSIIDEQHRFGVAQRARLWQKNQGVPPHILVMTATPIPRTLAMTLYGDLEVSVIDEMPPGRKPIKTVHKVERQRNQIFDFMRSEIVKGRQIYLVYPLIDENEKLDFASLEEGYESVKGAFPEPTYRIVMVHGRQKQPERDEQMQAFINGSAQIMVATTVIEVGVNVPNASVMVIESAQRFGLAQLHQLRGRVGRGAEQSYCILVTGDNMSEDTRTRIDTMVRTTNGFEIADVDLKLRGPGDLMGTQQSGAIELRFADLRNDDQMIILTRELAQQMLIADPELEKPENQFVRLHLDAYKGQRKFPWSFIS